VLIKAAHPGAECSGAYGRNTSFEITVNGKLIYSMLETKRFPIWQDVIDALTAIAAGGECPKIGLQPALW
jgi:hypothetical protein